MGVAQKAIERKQEQILPVTFTFLNACSSFITAANFFSRLIAFVRGCVSVEDNQSTHIPVERVMMMTDQWLSLMLMGTIMSYARKL
jgi:hypothetical protein